MKKIIVTSSRPDKEGKTLAAMLHVLFPECEIQVTDDSHGTRMKSSATAQNRDSINREQRKSH
ncbi:MAG: hypothetical protein JEZ02_08695 [Desulfatibacillum sp.]|nr:hypothetical protein [Desulfatibacillum sp.]